MNETWDARSKWEKIGLYLGVDQPTLDCISTNKNYNPDNCYPEVLSTWLRGSRATWSLLLEALRSPPVNCDAVADKIDNLSLKKKQEIGYF